MHLFLASFYSEHVPFCSGWAKRVSHLEKERIPGSPIVGIPHYHCSGHGSILGWGTKIPLTTWHGQTKEKQGKKKNIYIYNLVCMCEVGSSIEFSLFLQGSALVEKKGLGFGGKTRKPLETEV